MTFKFNLFLRHGDKLDISDTYHHIFYSKKMGQKYLDRYYKHFKKPVIHEFDLGHDAWLFNGQLMKTEIEKCFEYKPL